MLRVPQLAPHVATVPASGIRRVTELAWGIPDAIILSVGEPDLATAEHILAAAQQALARDDTRYTPNGGIRPLREAVAAQLASQGVDVAPEQVWITAGGAQALHLALTLTIAAGDEVLVPDPGYPPFTMATRIVQGVAVPYTLRAENGFLPDPADVEACITDRTRVLLLNSPSNPLGTVLDEHRVAALLDVARRHDLWVLSDEAYEAFCFDTPHVPTAAVDTDDRVMTLRTFSKTYAMTGLRIGVLVVPQAMVAVLPSVQEGIVSCVNTPTQYAALAALTGPQQVVAEASAVYREHRDLATGLLDSLGIPWLPAAGGIYLWADMSHVSGGDVTAWAESFVVEHGVAVAPGAAFGAAGEGWIRISLTATAADLTAGLSRLPARS